VGQLLPPENGFTLRLTLLSLWPRLYVVLMEDLLVAIEKFWLYFGSGRRRLDSEPDLLTFVQHPEGRRASGRYLIAPIARAC
jgi:hypothetical protein